MKAFTLSINSANEVKLHSKYQTRTVGFLAERSNKAVDITLTFDTPENEIHN